MFLKNTNQLKKYLKIFFIIICIGFLIYKFNISFFEISKKINLHILEFLFLVFLSIISYNFVVIRAYLLTKSLEGYAYSYCDWSKLFFDSVVINSIIPISGLVYRAIELKKRNLNYTNFISINYLLIGSYILISILFILLEWLLLNNIFFVQALIICAAILIILFFFSSVILENFIKFLLKFKIFIKYSESMLKLNEIIKKYFLQKKTIIILFFNTTILHVWDILLFYLVSDIFLDYANLQIIFALFVVSFVIDSVPFVSKTPGLSEVILGMVGAPLGIFFVDAALIKLSLRLLSYLSILSNWGLYFVINYFDKKKFVD
jgi:hypothetical protein